jgi:hypothetical protein
MKNGIAILGIMITLVACNEREGCNGYPFVAWTIPDTTLVIGLDSLVIDLTGSEESLLRHTADKTLDYMIQRDIGINVKIMPKSEDDIDSKWAIFYPKSPGEYTIGIFVYDECDKEDNTRFSIIAASEQTASVEKP